MSSLISSNLIMKNISYPTIYSLTKTHTFLPPFTSIKTKQNPHPPENYISLKTQPPNPPEIPSDPPPLSPNPAPEFPGPPIPNPGIQPPPNPAPEFPGPPIPDPEIQPPGPDMPVPPNTPGGPEVVPPTAPPEWMPPNPPDVGPQHPTPPEIQFHM